MGSSHEEKLHGGVLLCQLRHCTNQSERVEPVIDATTPDDDVIVLANSWHNPFENLAGVLGVNAWEAKRHHTEKSFKMRVIGITQRGNTTQGGELAQIEVTLAL
jgi:hypothetical protein